MRNILRDPPTSAEFRAIFEQHPPIPLLAPETDGAWQAAAKKPDLQKSLAALFSAAGEELDAPLPMLTDALYGDFAATGNRLPFEKLYFERRRRLARAALAALLETDAARKESFRRSLLQKAREIFAETSWALPAHVKDPSGRDPLTTDLFAAETANTFAELLNLFPRSLPAEFRDQILARLRTQFFRNYLVQNPMWLTATHNWNAVCHQGVLGAALAVESDGQLLADMVARAAQNLPNFLHGFTPDGATSEGPGYWSYGFGWFVELNAQLEARTGNELSLFHDDPLILNIARFGPAVALSNNHFVNFSDAAPSGSLRPSTLQYLADRLHDPVLQSHAQNSWHNLGGDPQDPAGQRADLFLWTRLALRCPEMAATASSIPLGDGSFPGVGWIVSRSRDHAGHLWEFAAKAGHNAEHHNHNDVGSFLLNIDGQRLLLEIGAPEYVKDFFRAETRYQFLAARSLGHSVPLINNREQPFGKEFRGEILEQQSTPAALLFSVDLTRAYPVEARVGKAVRTFNLDKVAGVLRIIDAFDLGAPAAVESAIIAGADTKLDGASALIRAGPITLRITPDSGAGIRELQPHAYNSHDGAPARITRIVLVPKELQPKTHIGCTIEIVP